MALVDTTWYTNFGDGSTTGYYAVTKWATGATIAAGALRRQNATPAVGNERVFVCIIAGTTNATTEPTWVLTRGAKTTDNTITWMEATGQAALNGDLTNTATWAQAKAATPAVLGQIIKRSSNASYQICTTAGAMSASEPAFSDTAGVTTTDTTAVWTSLGAVSNFTGGQAPHARLANVFGTSWFASGNTVYVGDNHAETQASVVSISPSSASMARILCHNHSGPYPPTALTTGASIATSSGSAVNIQGQGSFYFYGLTFIPSGATATMVIGATTVGQVQNWYYFDNCSFQFSFVGTAYVEVGWGTASTWAIVIFNNTTVKFVHVTQCVTVLGAQLTWQNTGQVLASGSLVPTTLIQSIAGVNINTIVLEALDLSQLTGSLYSNANAQIGSLTIKDCKLNAAATITQPINTGQVVQLSHSDSAAAAFRSTRSTYEAVESTETSIVRSGGYIDPTGQVQSRKIVTSVNAQWLRPYKGQALSVWNSTVGSSKTVTIYGTVNAGAVPNNDDIWMELSYLGSGASPLGTTVTTTKAQVWSANAAVPSDSSVWSGTSLATFDGVNNSSGMNQGPSNITISNNGLTATLISAQVGAMSSSFQTSGKYYFEVTVGQINSADYVGIATATAASVSVASNGANAFIVFRTGPIYSDTTNTTKTLGTIVITDIIGVAVDLTARKGWIRKNGGNWNGDATANPATNTAGLTIQAASGFAPVVGWGGGAQAAGDSFTANFGGSVYHDVAPSGFGNWPAAVGGWNAFKLSTTITPQLPGYITPVIKAAKAYTTFYIDPAVVVT